MLFGLFIYQPIQANEINQPSISIFVLRDGVSIEVLPYSSNTLEDGDILYALVESDNEFEVFIDGLLNESLSNVTNIDLSFLEDGMHGIQIIDSEGNDSSEFLFLIRRIPLVIELDRGPIIANRGELFHLIDHISSLNEDDYTRESWLYLEGILSQAIIVEGYTNSTQEEIDHKTNILRNAYNQLEKLSNNVDEKENNQVYTPLEEDEEIIIIDEDKKGDIIVDVIVLPTTGNDQLVIVVTTLLLGLVIYKINRQLV